MRIAIIAPPWATVPPSGYGGTESVLDTLARGLADEGHDVLLCTTGDSTCPVPKAHLFERAIGVGRGGVAAELRHVIAAYDAAADYDVVHDHTLTGLLYAERLPRLPVVTTNHGPFDSDLGDVYRATSGRVPVIAISHDQASKADGIRIAAVIHHGLDAGRFKVGPGDGGYALFLGRMSPDKGVHVAARVAHRAGVPLKIAAKMSEAAELEYFADAVRPLLSRDVEYVGEVAGEEKQRLLGGARCLLNPIAWPEPFGMVMIESMACGTPVVATPAGAAPEIVTHGHTGFLAPDEDGLVAALAKVEDLSRVACRADVETRFSAKKMVRAHLSVYDAVVASAGDSILAPPALLDDPYEASVA
jgi:glycosyltransferase involved in cell wall biosynthesis